MEILQRSNGIMEWNRLQTVHLTEDMRKKLEEIENYLEKQDYFSNEKLNRSRIIDMLILTFYDLFVAENSRTKYPNRLAELKKITPKDNQKLLRELMRQGRSMEFLLYINLGIYQSLSQINGSYTPKDLRSYQTGDSREINMLMNQIMQIINEDVARNKQIKDSKRKKA